MRRISSAWGGIVWWRIWSKCAARGEEPRSITSAM